MAAARKLGICRCGGKLDTKPGSTRIYSTCPECREKAKASANRYYREGPLPPRVIPPAKLDGRLRDSTGVRRRLERDGLERVAWWWFASAASMTASVSGAGPLTNTATAEHGGWPWRSGVNG